MCDFDKEDGRPFGGLTKEDVERHQCKLMHHGADVYEECKMLKLLNIEQRKLTIGTPDYSACVAKIEIIEKAIAEKEQMQIGIQRKGEK